MSAVDDAREAILEAMEPHWVRGNGEDGYDLFNRLVPVFESAIRADEAERWKHGYERAGYIRAESAGGLDVAARKVADAVQGMADFYEWDAIPYDDHGLPEKHVIDALAEYTRLAEAER